jgi:hypothetical protein
MASLRVEMMVDVKVALWAEMWVYLKAVMTVAL